MVLEVVRLAPKARMSEYLVLGGWDSWVRIKRWARWRGCATVHRLCDPKAHAISSQLSLPLAYFSRYD